MSEEIYDEVVYSDRPVHKMRMLHLKYAFTQYPCPSYLMYREKETASEWRKRITEKWYNNEHRCNILCIEEGIIETMKDLTNWVPLEDLEKCR